MNAPNSKQNDGWTGQPCPQCEGTGEVNTDHSYAACGACGGTGEQYVAELDKRESA